MTKLYVFSTVAGFIGDWAEALERGKVEIVATIEGKDQKTVEKKAHELYGDSDTYGWTYSAEGLDEAEQVERINLDEGEGEPMTKKEHFADRLEITGDFWRVCQEVINKGWTFSDLEDAGVIQDLYGFTDTTFEENLIHLKNMLLAPRHRNISAFFEAMREALKDPSVLDSEAGRKEWVKDLENSLATTGGNDYEIPGRLTKSGNPELYTITREWFTAPDGEEDYLIVH